MASHPIYQFYAELDEYKPKIWRRFQVADNVTLARLGYILQVLFEMKASHLMAFEVPVSENFRATWRQRYPNMDEDTFKLLDSKEIEILRYEMMDENFESIDMPNIKELEMRNERIRHVVTVPNEKLHFNYDFGDDWRVTLTLEKVFEDKELPGGELPRVLEGAGFGIVEDVGGVWGLADLAKAFKKKKGADYKQFSEWLGVSDFDMLTFDVGDMNFRLKKIPRIYKQCYEDRQYPTQKSIDLIERKYLMK